MLNPPNKVSEYCRTSMVFSCNEIKSIYCAFWAVTYGDLGKLKGANTDGISVKICE